MNELRLLFDKAAGETYRVRLDNNWGGNASSQNEFTPFLKEDDFENLRWYLEEFMDLPDGGSLVRAQRIEAELAAWGCHFYEAIFPAGPNRNLLEHLLKLPSPRVLTVGTDDPRLLRLPWELIADTAGPLAPRVSVRRQLAEPEAVEPRTVQLPLRILYIVSRPSDTGFIDPRLTTRSLFDALDPLGPSVRMDFCRPPTVAQMESMLRDAEKAGDPYDIVHFDGHGTFIPEIQLGALCFEKADDGSGPAATEFVRADALGAVLAQRQVPLVVLEACRSATVGQTAVFRSVAPRLIQAGVASVLSMGHAVHVEAARRLLDRFYRELVCGATIGQAVAEARATLLAGRDRWIEYGPQGRTIMLEDWFLPHLYQRGLDEPLLPPATPDAAGNRPRQFDLFLSHQHADQARVERLARTLSDKHGLRVWLDKWECKPGPLKPQCEAGIVNSRYTVVVGSEQALKSKWVQWEVEQAFALNPDGTKLLPVKFEDLALPPELEGLLWVDFRDPAHDDENARQLARLIRSTDAEDARERRGFRSPPLHKDEVGQFPPAPMYGFQGRARELHELERQFRTQRGIVLHAMGGMGKTALATEAAGWWTRAGRFRDGACFLSFEQFASTERAIQVLGTYLEGPNFESLPAAEQRLRAIELFNNNDVLFVWDNFESVLPQFSLECGDSSPLSFSPSFVPSRSSDPPCSARVSDPACSARVSDPAETSDRRSPSDSGDLRSTAVARSETGHNAVEEESKEGKKAATSRTHSIYSPDERGRLFELFRDLTAAPAGRGRLLVTCRPGETGLPGAQKTDLQGLARADSLWLLSRVIAKDNLTLGDPRLGKEKLGELLDLLADHPLSIELVGPHLKALTPQEIIADFGRLLAGFKRGEGKERNESLLASLAFSTSRLSAAAQSVLPWLALFTGGVFEQLLLDVIGDGPESGSLAQHWESIRAELEATALIRVEREIDINSRPYLRFHPTLSYAVGPGRRTGPKAHSVSPTGPTADARRRFIQVYGAVCLATDKALRGSSPQWGMEVLLREEANFRTAVRWSVDVQDFPVASAMGATFREYLERSGRLRERDAWITWLAAEIRKGGFCEVAAANEQEEAWALFTQGQAGEAIRRLEKLRERLLATTEFDAADQLAMVQYMLGKVMDHIGLSEQAIPALEDAVSRRERLVSRASADEADAGNLATALGCLAGALMSVGRLEDALIAAQRALQIDATLGRARDIAAGLGTRAQILAAMGRHAEADEAYDNAITAAHRVGDKQSEAVGLHNQAILAFDLRQYDRAAKLCMRALKLSQEMNDEGAVMRVCNLLGSVEERQDRLAEARAWYQRSREIAEGRGDIGQLAAVAQNIGIVCQSEGVAARRGGREPEARQWFADARRSIQQGLQLQQQIGNGRNRRSGQRQPARVTG